MSDTEALLNSLRDIQEPIAPASTSIWLMGANLLAMIVIVCLLYAHRKRRKNGWRREALFTIKRARGNTPQAGTLALAKTLRQIVLMRDSTGQELQGNAWLEKLDSHFSTTWFSQGSGQIFGNALYRNNPSHPEEYLVLCDSVSKLIKQLPNQQSRSTSGQ